MDAPVQPASDPDSLPARFTTRHGISIPLDPRHRRSVRLPSTTGYGRAAAGDDDVGVGGDGDGDGDGDGSPGEDGLVGYLAAVGRRVELSRRLLALGGKDLDGADVLILGASDGAEAIWCHAIGATSVIGTDYGDTFVGETEVHLAPLRERLLEIAERRGADIGLMDIEQIAPPVSGGSFEFLVDDITGSRLDDASFDVILSWQTLEHVLDVPAAMDEMGRLLRPDGVMVHEYNPFFSIDGGHSAATLDMPWGHVRLDDTDLERYLRTLRPDEADQALTFLDRSVNRATQADVCQAAVDASLSLEAWLPRTRTEDLLVLDPSILEQCHAVHPDVEVIDLVSRIVRFVARHPRRP